MENKMGQSLSDKTENIIIVQIIDKYNIMCTLI